MFKMREQKYIQFWNELLFYLCRFLMDGINFDTIIWNILQ